MFVAHSTSREHGDVPGWGSSQGPRGCPGAVQNWLCRKQQFRELAPSLTGSSTWEGRLCALPRQHSGTDPAGWGVVGCRFRATVPVEKKEAAVTVNGGRFHSLAVL